MWVKFVITPLHFLSPFYSTEGIAAYCNKSGLRSGLYIQQSSCYNTKVISKLWEHNTVSHSITLTLLSLAQMMRRDHNTFEKYHSLSPSLADAQAIQAKQKHKTFSNTKVLTKWIKPNTAMPHCVGMFSEVHKIHFMCHTCFCFVTKSQSSTSHFLSSSGISTFTSWSGVGSRWQKMSMSGMQINMQHYKHQFWFRTLNIDKLHIEPLSLSLSLSLPFGRSDLNNLKTETIFNWVHRLIVTINVVHKCAIKRHMIP